eukprot:scaffold121752_cov29-Tisochrysis_lutea.AAC.1
MLFWYRSIGVWPVIDILVSFDRRTGRHRKSAPTTLLWWRRHCLRGATTQALLCFALLGIGCHYCMATQFHVQSCACPIGIGSRIERLEQVS